MEYKDYHIEETVGGHKVYRSREAWIDGEEPLHTARSLTETEQWIDQEPSGESGNPSYAYLQVEVADPLRKHCGETNRQLFEEAAIKHLTGSGEEAGKAYGIAIQALHRCLGIEPTPDRAVEECERWFSFFNLWGAARFLDRGRDDDAIRILTDQEESYRRPRSAELGILQDYGQEQTNRLHSGTSRALECVKKGLIGAAVVNAEKVADIQYWLAVNKSGTPTPIEI